MYSIIKIPNKSNEHIKSKDYDLYSYDVFTGKQNIFVESGDSAWIVEGSEARIERGGQSISFDGVCVVIRGYQCETKTSRFESVSNLPYVNGCSSHQVFPPIRIGDPTMQLLYLPPNTKEQIHHIHSTTRVVYVKDGRGYSIQGMKGEKKIELNKGDIIILDKMTPHHFKTIEDELIVIPIHIFSSTDSEYNHPMRNGTFSV